MHPKIKKKRILVTELSNIIIKSLVKENWAIVLKMSSLILCVLGSKKKKKINYMDNRISIKTSQINQTTCSRQDHIYSNR